MATPPKKPDPNLETPPGPKPTPSPEMAPVQKDEGGAKAKKKKPEPNQTPKEEPTLPGKEKSNKDFTKDLNDLVEDLEGFVSSMNKDIEKFLGKMWMKTPMGKGLAAGMDAAKNLLQNAASYAGEKVQQGTDKFKQQATAVKDRISSEFSSLTKGNSKDATSSSDASDDSVPLGQAPDTQGADAKESSRDLESADLDGLSTPSPSEPTAPTPDEPAPDSTPDLR